MKILVDLAHPAHIHLFKDAIWIWEKKGHKVKITAKDKDILFKLLDNYNFQYEITGKDIETLPGKAIGMLEKDYRMLKIAKNFKPDIFVSVTSPHTSHVSRLIKKPNIAFEDTERASLVRKMSMPFTDAICTPSCFLLDLGPKHIRYNGFHELAYLHSNYFKPNLEVLNEEGISKNEKFFIIRLVSWEASHDIGEKGISEKQLQKLIELLKEKGKILISSEKTLPKKFQQFEFRFAPEKIHDFLFFAEMYIGEGATMATEAALLGTPSIYISSLAGTMGNLIELEKEYKLVYSFRIFMNGYKKSIELLKEDNLKNLWKLRRNKVIKDKIDVTKFITESVINYPNYLNNYKKKINLTKSF